MDLRRMTYLERKMDENRKMEGHHDYPFDDDDLREPKENPTIGYTMGGRTLHRTLHRPELEIDQDELFDKLQKSLKKELCDVLRYHKMAEMAEAEGHRELAEGLKEICYDEYTHASFIRTNLHHYDRDPEKSDSEISSMWHKVSHLFEIK